MQIGEIKGTTCEKHGVALGTAIMQDVMYVPSGHFNLFFLTNMTKAGWILSANKDRLWFEKGGAKLVFDIIISMPSWMLYAMYIN